MRILIVEDERPTAEDIGMLVREILKKDVTSIHIETTVANALAFLDEKPIDLLLLDLNLNAKDGFQILRHVASRAFHTIVISANINRAIEAFEHGVLDFIPKPYTLKRLRAAFDRLQSSHAVDGHAMKYLSVRSGSEIRVVPIDDVRYFRSANIYVELLLKDGRTLLYDKPFKQLLPLLPSNFVRIHKSYIVDVETIDSLQTLGGGQYRASLKCGDVLPVSRHQIDALRSRFGHTFD